MTGDQLLECAVVLDREQTVSGNITRATRLRIAGQHRNATGAQIDEALEDLALQCVAER